MCVISHSVRPLMIGHRGIIVAILRVWLDGMVWGADEGGSADGFLREDAPHFASLSQKCRRKTQHQMYWLLHLGIPCVI